MAIQVDKEIREGAIMGRKACTYVEKEYRQNVYKQSSGRMGAGRQRKGGVG